jgi:hypothetical protein
MVDLEDLSDEELTTRQEEFKRLREKSPSLVDDDIQALENTLVKRAAHKNIPTGR